MRMSNSDPAKLHFDNSVGKAQIRSNADLRSPAFHSGTGPYMAHFHTSAASEGRTLFRREPHVNSFSFFWRGKSLIKCIQMIYERTRS